MSVSLSYQLGGYQVQADVDLPEGAVRSADMLPVHRKISDTLADAVIARVEANGNSISCHKGCSACCKRLYVEVSEAEAYRLRDTIQSLPPEHRARIESRFDAIRDQLVKVGLYDVMLEMCLQNAESRERLGVDYYQQAIACPFLENDQCSIYEERPLACREYLVSSPSVECSRPLQGGVQRIRFPSTTFDNAMRMTQSCYDDVPLIPLSLLPSWLERHPEPEEHPSGIELLMRSFSGLSFQLHAESGNESRKPEVAPQRASRPPPAVESDNADGEIVPDYAIPAALMVPHYGMAPIELMENIAAAAAKSTGVILLTPDPQRTQAFIDSQPEADRFTMVVATSDTAWIQDRAPIVVTGRGDSVEWYLPRLSADGREADASLFETICKHPTRPSPFTLARGNLIAGPGGLALSSNLLLDENMGGELSELKPRARQLGIKRWVVFTPFTQEPTGHADLHVRFLSEELAAVAWSLTSEADRKLAEDLVAQLSRSLPGVRVLRLPMRSEDSRYASPLNWIQLGTELLVPRYELTQEEDVEQIRELLSKEGFSATFIDSPTLDTGGSLHCLTASVYL